MKPLLGGGDLTAVIDEMVVDHGDGVSFELNVSIFVCSSCLTKSKGSFLTEVIETKAYNCFIGANEPVHSPAGQMKMVFDQLLLLDSQWGVLFHVIPSFVCGIWRTYAARWT